MLLDRLAKSQERISDVVAFTSASRFISMDVRIHSLLLA